MNVLPDFDGLAGIGDLREIGGALLMFSLVIAVLMLIVSAIIWAVSSSTGNYAIKVGGRPGIPVLVGLTSLEQGPDGVNDTEGKWRETPETLLEPIAPDVPLEGGTP